MRGFRPVPASYRADLDAAIRAEIERIEQDVAGLNTVPSFMKDEKAQGELMIMIVDSKSLRSKKVQ